MKKIYLFSIVVLLFCSCEKEETKNATGDLQSVVALAEELSFGEFSKMLTIYDETGENSALIKIGSDDEEYFNLISDKTLAIIPVKQGESALDALNEYNSKNYPEELSSEEAIEEEDDSGIEGNTLKCYAAVLSTSLVDDVEGLIFINNTPNPTKAEWETHDIYGFSPRTGAYYGIQTAKFIGQNNWHVGYYGLEYNPLNDTIVSTIVSNYQKIRTGQTVEKTRTNCNYMVAHLKYKGTPPSVVVEFLY